MYDDHPNAMVSQKKIDELGVHRKDDWESLMRQLQGCNLKVK